MNLRTPVGKKFAMKSTEAAAHDRAGHEPVDLCLSGGVAILFPHQAALTLILWPLIWVRLSLAMTALACSATTSTNKCRPRISTAPTMLPGRPVSPEIVL